MYQHYSYQFNCSPAKRSSHKEVRSKWVNNVNPTIAKVSLYIITGRQVNWSIRALMEITVKVYHRFSAKFTTDKGSVVASVI